MPGREFGANWEVTAKGCRVSLWSDKNVLMWTVVTVAQFCESIHWFVRLMGESCDLRIISQWSCYQKKKRKKKSREIWQEKSVSMSPGLGSPVTVLFALPLLYVHFKRKRKKQPTRQDDKLKTHLTLRARWTVDSLLSSSAKLESNKPGISFYLKTLGKQNNAAVIFHCFSESIRSVLRVDGTALGSMESQSFRALKAGLEGQRGARQYLCELAWHTHKF